MSANENNTQYTLGIGVAVTNGTPEILYQSICYIKDTKQQCTHGPLYSGNVDASEQVIKQGNVDNSAVLKGEYKVNSTTYSNKALSQVSVSVGAGSTAATSLYLFLSWTQVR